MDDLLDVSRFQTGRYRLERSEFDLAVLVRQVTPGLQRTTSRHRLELDVPREKTIVGADENRIRQVLNNLIGNAIHYSPGRGTIRISLRAEAHRVEVRVSDQGIGIPRDQLGRIFEPFYRVDTPLRQQVSGTGLGLAICRRIVEAHDGHIWVHSEEGVGSVFGFALPAVSDSVRAY